jgi:hypothetical protein
MSTEETPRPSSTLKIVPIEGKESFGFTYTCISPTKRLRTGPRLVSRLTSKEPTVGFSLTHPGNKFCISNEVFNPVESF